MKFFSFNSCYIHLSSEPQAIQKVQYTSKTLEAELNILSEIFLSTENFCHCSKSGNLT